MGPGEYQTWGASCSLHSFDTATLSHDTWSWRGHVKRQLTVKAAARRNIAEYVSECMFARHWHLINRTSISDD
jgi:hypothetical protein